LEWGQTHNIETGSTQREEEPTAWCLVGGANTVTITLREWLLIHKNDRFSMNIIMFILPLSFLCMAQLRVRTHNHFAHCSIQYYVAFVLFYSQMMIRNYHLLKKTM